MGDWRGFRYNLSMTKEIELLYQAASKELLKENFIESAELLKKILDTARYPPALRKLGFMYANSIGIEGDKSKAMSLFQEASDLGDIESTHYLAEFKLNIYEDYSDAIKLYETGVQSGFFPSMYRLAWIYDQSEKEEERNYSLSLFKQAAENGHVYSIGSYIRRALRFKYGFLEIFKIPYYVLLLVFNAICFNHYDPQFKLMK